jgi:hypothetical protein
MSHWRDGLVTQARTHPVRTLAVLVGVGYVAGGGLFSRMTIRLLKVGMRISPRFGWIPLIASGMATFLQGTSDKQRENKNFLKNKPNGHESNANKNEGDEKGV